MLLAIHPPQGEELDFTTCADQLLEARSKVRALLETGRESEVFLAFCETVAGTEIRVGATEAEDPDNISPERVADYLVTFLDAEQIQLNECVEQNGIDSEQAAAELTICGWRLYTGIVGRIEPPLAA